MLILPESIKTLINAFMAIFAKREDVKQSDWNQTDATKMDFIKNKPEEPTDEEFLQLLMDMDIVQPLSDNNGTVYTAADNKIYVL